MQDQPPTAPGERRPRRRRDFWQLDVPLVIALAVCVSATVIEVNRAGAGNWRAAVYAVEWPLIGAFCVWMWFRFRREGGSFRGIADRWKARVAQYEAEAAADEPSTQKSPAESREAAPVVDPGLDAWQRYRADVRDREQSEGRG